MKTLDYLLVKVDQLDTRVYARIESEIRAKTIWNITIERVDWAVGHGFSMVIVVNAGMSLAYYVNTVLPKISGIQEVQCLQGIPKYFWDVEGEIREYGAVDNGQPVDESN